MRDQRKLFEQWVLEQARFYRLYKNTDGNYASTSTAAAWTVWQGCVTANSLPQESEAARAGKFTQASTNRPRQ